jgi:phosphoribosylamine--glycine ligase
MGRFLGVGETCDLSALYLGLVREGHAVRVHVSHPLAQGTLAGLVDKVDDWRSSLDWVGRDGVILFESVSEGLGRVQDELRREGYRVIGGSAAGDRLENDRGFAQAVLARQGLSIAEVWDFETARSAIDFIAGRPGCYVAKFSGAGHASSDSYVGRLADGRDVAAFLKARSAHDHRPLILMPRLEGVETGVGAFFNGEGFMTPACLDWEHKRFFPGDLGELTGEMGTVVTYDRSAGFFQRVLRPLEPLFRQAGHVGWVNLNTIVNEDGVWPLEFSCRFGYPGYAILAPLQAEGWGGLLTRIAERCGTHVARQGFSVGLVMTTPPFPYDREQIEEAVGMPVIIGEAVDPTHVHFGEVGLDQNGDLVTSGLYGWSLVVTGCGLDVESARAQALANVRGVVIPNARYRTDIGERLAGGDLRRLERLGLFDSIPAPSNERVSAP